MTPSTPPPTRSDAPTGSLGHRASDAPGPVSDAPAVGTVIDRYTILERVGGGGMGEVFAAYDGKLDRKVALKLLRHKSEEYESRLMREAQAMARLAHPNVVAVFDTGRVGDKLYLAMEFVRGETLRKWQKGAPRSRAEILRAYIDAGQGLAAAHDAGLVHRDFKPDNVLLAEDGRVKVTDFGIARAQNEEPVPAEGTRGAKLRSFRPPAVKSEATVSSPPSSGTPPTSGALDSPMTQEGTLLGTPGYMAPEQFLCEAVDARTDQFSFCVSLYEAIYGERPFAPRRGEAHAPTLEEIAQATLEGKIPEPPRGMNVPVHLRRVVLRGLAPVREERYPSMRELLADLARDPGAKQRRVFAATAALAALCTLTFFGVRAANARQATLCAATDAEAAEAWDGEAAQKAEKAILATGLPYAADTWTRTKAELDGYMGKWKAMHKQTCEATRIHGHQTEAVMTLRMSCLDQRKSEVKALAHVLGTADKDVTAKALQAAMNLTSVDACKDVASLTAMVPEPIDAAKRTELKSVREGIAAMKENANAGRFEVARAQADEIVTRARAVHHAPVLAQAHLTAARAKAFSGASRDECISHTLEAVKQADAGRDDETRVDAALMVGMLLETRGSVSEADAWFKVADAVLRRLGDQGLRRAQWLTQAGHLAHTRGNEVDALRLSREAVELSRTAGVPPDVLANTLRQAADFDAVLGNQAEAEHLLAEAEELVARTMGPEHPVRLRVMLSHQVVAGLGGNYEDAVEFGKKAIALAQRIAPRGESEAIGQVNTCGYLADMKDFASSLDYCARAVELMREVFGPESNNLAHAHINTGNTLLGLQRFEEARAAFQAALRIFERSNTSHEATYLEALDGLGEAQLGLSAFADAEKTLDSAVTRGAAMDTSAERDKKLARAEFALGRTRWARGERGARVNGPVQDASATYRRVGFAVQADEADAWLAKHAK